MQFLRFKTINYIAGFLYIFLVASLKVISKISNKTYIKIEV